MNVHSQSGLCKMSKYKTFCQVHKETVYHLFWSCFYKQLWESIGKFIKDNIQQDVSATFKDIMFGYFDFDPD